MSEQEDLVSMINLLAGAAQAGAKGVLAQAALNVVLASEAVVKARNLKLEQSIRDATLNILNDSQKAFFKASAVKGAMEEAKKDILDHGQKPYQPISADEKKGG